MPISADLDISTAKAKPLRYLLGVTGFPSANALLIVTEIGMTIAGDKIDKMVKGHYGIGRLYTPNL